MNFNLLVILGPTAVGKTSLAVKLAQKFNGEIISADSRQVYRYMNIGTGKDISEYSQNNKLIPYHLIDIIDPREEYNLFSFIKDFNYSFQSILSKEKLPILCGGTAMYVHAVLKGYEMKTADLSGNFANELNTLDTSALEQMVRELKPGLHNKTDLTDRNRMISAIIIASGKGESITPDKTVRPFIIGTFLPRDEVKRNIALRLEKRLKEGMIEEVKTLLEMGVSSERLKQLGLEYRFVMLFLFGEISYDEMHYKLRSAINDFAKRQMTWYRKMEREGIKIHWIEIPFLENSINLIGEYFNDSI